MAHDPGTRMRIVGVMGSGASVHGTLARDLGRWIARNSCHLLTGGGGGEMSAVSKAFSEIEDRQGRVLGIIPGTVEGETYRRKPDYPNPWVEIAIFTHLPLTGRDGLMFGSRNHINVLTSDVIVALPGGEGTASEVHLAVKYGKPVIAFLGRDGTIPNLPAGVPRIEHERVDEVGAFISRSLKEWSPD